MTHRKRALATFHELGVLVFSVKRIALVCSIAFASRLRMFSCKVTDGEGEFTDGVTRWLNKVLMVKFTVSVSGPTFTAGANPIVRIYPRFLHLIGPS